MMAPRRARVAARPLFAERLLDAHCASAQPTLSVIFKRSSNVHLEFFAFLQEPTVYRRGCPGSEKLGN